MTSHEDKGLTSVASIDDEEEPRQSSSSYAEPDESWFLPNDQISYRAEERGLCSVCSQYDWHWHLTPDRNVIPASGYYRSRSDYDQRSLVTGEKFHHDLDKSRDGYVPTTRAPYPGHYAVTCTGVSPITTHIQLSPFSTMLRTRVYCALCDLVLRAVGAKVHGKELKKLQTSSMPTLLRCGPRWGPSSVLEISKIESDGLEMSWVFLNLLSEVTQPPPKYGRITRSDQVDLKVLKHLWTTCQKDHPECAFDPTQFEARLPTANVDRELRVIDIKQARVVSAPLGCRYLALSYVWGAGKRSLIVTSNFIDPSPNSDRSLSSAAYAVLDQDSLSPIFKDAMGFTELIGERYLWIDQLCIVQDNIQHKTYLISNMDRIYKGALCTIVAADSNVHSVGLSGFRPKSRNYDPVSGTIDNVDLIIAEPDIDIDSYDSPLGTSAWNKRGWTYQEFMLSSRIYVFVGGRVYYQCTRGVVGEAEPGRNLGRFYTISGGHKRYDREPFAHYGELVRQYTNRILTFPEDILHAFAGLMSDFSDRFGSEFCYGLPTNHIYFGLMWKTVTGNNNEMARRDGFPSWSWAGWFNAVEYDMNLAFKSLNVHIEWRDPKIDWNTVQRTGALEFRTQVVLLNREEYPQTFEAYQLDQYNWGGMDLDMDDNREEWNGGPWECLKIAHMYQGDDDGPEHGASGLLVVKEIKPGIYQREGFVEAFTPWVDRFESTVKDIILV